ncbi:hypothetical protein APS56_00420 [Pseudalgibacter alginicilyticus]|uniref:Peptidase M48 domain-containing protein n=1 Tax=Pseudalgibacter alginicilyticus TaxID=1736674 RepID=A0A0P0D559_9FLAO|nr:hypothetical protein [Pseudalgibacter alginicilyticus]ALJ03704.1 hypothetical protein APS56_00420 [Pseudalgibacter alginicilyticus]
MKTNFILVLIFLNLYNLNAQHIYPNSIETEVKKALSYYPELEKVPIEFKFKNKIKKSTMQAQPNFWSVFCKKSKRKYKVLISENFKILDTVYETKNIPSNVLIGWLGHELGHIMDYQHRSGFNLIGFGIGYLFSKKALKSAERSADTFAVIHGMEDYILATKDFILNEAGFPEIYTNRIKRFYLSPEEIMILVEERDEKAKLSELE